MMKHNYVESLTYPKDTQSSETVKCICRWQMTDETLRNSPNESERKHQQLYVKIPKKNQSA